jgi:hypothetical protein
MGHERTGLSCLARRGRAACTVEFRVRSRFQHPQLQSTAGAYVRRGARAPVDLAAISSLRDRNATGA